MDVIGLGHCAIDYLGTIPIYPDVDSKVEIDKFSIQGGGPAATAMVTLSRLGFKTGFIGKISDDQFGNFIKNSLEGENVDLSNLIIEKDKISPYSFIAVEQNTGNRNIFWTPGNVSTIKLNEIDFDYIKQAKILLVDSHNTFVQQNIAKQLKNSDIKVVMDGGTLRQGGIDLIKESDVVILSERFVIELGMAGELTSKMNYLAQLAPKKRTVIVTMGKEGSIGIEKGIYHKEPAFNIKAIDTTGAGDVYHGAYIYGMLQNWPMKKSMKFASITSALKCKELGGRAGIPDLKTVMDLMEDE